MGAARLITLDLVEPVGEEFGESLGEPIEALADVALRLSFDGARWLVVDVKE